MNKYAAYELNLLTPDGKEDLNFTVNAAVSCSDERSVGLSACERSVDIDFDSIIVEPIEGYDTEELKNYVIKQFETDKEKKDSFEEDIYNLWCNRQDAAYYDAEDYKIEKLIEKARGIEK